MAPKKKASTVHCGGTGVTGVSRGGKRRQGLGFPGVGVASFHLAEST